MSDAFHEEYAFCYSNGTRATPEIAMGFCAGRFECM